MLPWPNSSWQPHPHARRPDAGVHPKIVRERLDRSQISLTLDTQSHVLPGMGREAASKLDALLIKTAAEAPDTVAKV